MNIYENKYIALNLNYFDKERRSKERNWLHNVKLAFH